MYTDRFGLSGQPFQLTPDARFWFDSRTHRKAMAYLGYGLAQGEGFIVVTGEIGAGKSTLVAHLMANIDRARLNAISLVSTQVEGDDMLRWSRRASALRPARSRRRACSTRSSAARARAARRQAHPADRRRGAEPARLGARRAAHALQFPDRGAGADPDLPARPAGIPRQARRPRPGAIAPAGDRHPPSRCDGRRRGRILYPPPADPGRLAGPARFRRRRLRGDPPLQRRHPAPGEPARPSAAAQRRGRGSTGSAPPPSTPSPPTWAPTPPLPRARRRRRCCRCVRPGRPPLPLRFRNRPPSRLHRRPSPPPPTRISMRASPRSRRRCEQEETLRRALTMLVDWVEADGQDKAYRTHAA
jgi:energy-coupling factor transporter ATP-binding protein EcfA2